MFIRGHQGGATVRREFEISKEAFDRGKIGEADRFYFTVRTLTAEERSVFQDQIVDVGTVGKGKKSKQHVTMRTAAAGLELVRKNLVMLEKYGVQDKTGAQFYLEWNPEDPDHKKAEKLDFIEAEDLSEIREAILNYSELDFETEKN